MVANVGWFARGARRCEYAPGIVIGPSNSTVCVFVVVKMRHIDVTSFEVHSDPLHASCCVWSLGLRDLGRLNVSHYGERHRQNVSTENLGRESVSQPSFLRGGGARSQLPKLGAGKFLTDRQRHLTVIFHCDQPKTSARNTCSCQAITHCAKDHLRPTCCIAEAEHSHPIASHSA